MHGRVKVRTTEEQAEIKRKEQQEKLKVYLEATTKIFDKRENKECDEEALQLTGRILERNPDFYTLWNYRREILLSMKPEKNAEEIKAMASTELNLTQHCLHENPKSYATWHHRFWAMEFNPEADWKKELKLCGIFLSKDERNFHCWDYRRLVAFKCEVSPVEELNFSTELINSNFSNYSAWHYRSTLLPIVHPGPIKGCLDENVLVNELKLVQNAAYTDPDDQSAWIYHRWLLGRSKVPLQMLNVTLLKSQHKVAVLFSEPEKVTNESLMLLVDWKHINVMWESVSSYIPVSSVWVCCLPVEINMDDINDVTVEWTNKEVTSILKCSKENQFSVWSKDNRPDTFRSELSVTGQDILKEELYNCEQLIEMDNKKTDSKWPLFTSVLLIRALNYPEYQETTKEYIKCLKRIDSARKNYYDDFESKIEIEDYIESLSLEAKEVNLAKKNLSTLHHCDQFIFIERIDLSFNNLKSIFPLCHLVSVKEIIVDNNQLTDFVGLERLQNLIILSAKSNLIQSVNSLEVLKSCENLETLYIDDNPILQEDLSTISLSKKCHILKQC